MADRRALLSEPDTVNNTPLELPSLGFTSSSPPTSPPQPRPGYSRLPSDIPTFERATPPTFVEESEEDIADSFRSQSGSGLGIGSAALPPVNSPGNSPGNSRRVSIQTIPRRPVQHVRSPPAKSPNTLSPPGTGDPFLGGFPTDSADNTPDLRRERFSPRDEGGEYEESRRSALKNPRKSTSSLNHDYQQYLHSPDTQRLRANTGALSIKSAYENDFRPSQECPTAKDFYHSRFTWVSVTIVIICLFSAVFSGIFLGLALKAPRYGRSITSQGSFTPSDAIILTSIVAKLIELSFVTAFVAFLGQVLSRRAFMKEHGRGVTLSELSMWRWVVQPGTLITHWETAKYAGLSVLGILSLLSAVLTTLYTSAATALVQPTLKFGSWENMLMSGQVKADFANVNYIMGICQTPVRTDRVYGASTCLQIEHAGQGYHNYQRFLGNWKQEASNGNGSAEQHKRPQGFGLLHENTTITGQWVNIINTTEVSKKHGRAINNVSLAMPHSGVFQAARDERNHILQPEELNSEGTYFLRASVPSPVMNVLCANMDEKELEPIIYDKWPSNETVNGTTWDTILKNNATTTNATAVDELFGWTKQDNETLLDYPPVFAKLPQPYNTILNHSSAFWGRDSIYLLGQGGADDGGSDLTGIFVLCKIHVTLTPHCSTHYNATGSGGSMQAHCEDPNDDMAYIKSNSSAPDVKLIPNWKDVGFDWANSLSLNTGIDDGRASNSRLLTQYILKPSNPDPENFEVDLNPTLPSVAEALSVLSGCTLLKSMQDTPFMPDWNYTLPMLETAQTQYFNASLKAQQYGSGGVDNVSKGWILILFLVFLMNIFILVYFLVHRGSLVTDFSEPPNLFALAVNSPPSHLLAGSCGGGPQGKQYVVNWFVNTEGGHLYMEPGEKPPLYTPDHDHIHDHDDTHNHPNVHVQPPSLHSVNSRSTPAPPLPPTNTAPQPKSNLATGYFAAIAGVVSKLRAPGSAFRRKPEGARFKPANIAEPEFELEDGETRTQRQYAMLAKRRSML